MRLANKLLSLCIASLALGVDGNVVDYRFMALAAISALLFMLTARDRKVPKQVGRYSGAEWYLSLVFGFYALFSSLVVFSFSNTISPVISTISFLLLPASFILFTFLGLSEEDWRRIDLEDTCVNAALVFSSVLVLENPAAFMQAITGNSRFTWIEFRSVNPLPVLGALLLIWKNGLASLKKWQLYILLLYVYSTKYTNWFGILLFAIPLRYIISSQPRIWASAAFSLLIVFINALIALNWRDVYVFAPKEFARLYELYISHSAFVERPFFGIGFGSSYAKGFYEAYTVHNLLAYVLSSAGLVGISIFLALIATYARVSSSRSEYLMISYLILTVTAASYKLPAFQVYLGIAVAGMRAMNSTGKICRN